MIIMIMIVIFMMVIVMTMMINYYHCYTLLYFCIMSFRPNVRHTHTETIVEWRSYTYIETLRGFIWFNISGMRLETTF